jgi:RNA polymerase sigma factor (sigma-70 family)
MTPRTPVTEPQPTAANTCAPAEDRRSTAAAQLVRRVRAGDNRAWRELVEAYSGLIRAVARSHRLPEADAADVVQTTWLRAFEHVGRLKQPERLPAWLVTVARRESLRLLRNGKRCSPVEADFLAEIPDTQPVDATLLERERNASLWRAVGALPARQKETLRLLVHEPEASYETIGATLAMPVGSIGPTRLRALCRLRGDTALASLAGPE